MLPFGTWKTRRRGASASIPAACAVRYRLGRFTYNLQGIRVAIMGSLVYRNIFNVLVHTDTQFSFTSRIPYICHNQGNEPPEASRPRPTV